MTYEEYLPFMVSAKISLKLFEMLSKGSVFGEKCPISHDFDGFITDYRIFEFTTGFVISAPSFGAFLLYNITQGVGIESLKLLWQD